MSSLETLFNNPAATGTGGPEVLDHDLNRYFPELLKFESTAEMAASPIVEEIRKDAERILNAVVVSEPGAVATGFLSDGIKTPFPTAPGSDLKAVAWNIERGSIFEGIVGALQNHTDLNKKDVLLLTGLD